MSKTCDEIITNNLIKLVDVAEETGDCKELLEKLATSHKCAVLAFIAPYAPVRISPVEIQTASIGLSEEFAIVSAIEKMKDRNVNDLYILINSPGGIVPASYKISKMLRSSFKKIKAFVPHMAASGGALIALSANEVVMGPMSHLTPIDAQVNYNGQYVSSYSMNRALSRLTHYFEKITVDEAPYPWRAMTDKLDPVLMEDWSCYLTEMARYAGELMEMSGYTQDKIGQVVGELVFPAVPHNFVIDKDRAERMGIRISRSSQDMIDLKLMKAWLTGYMLTESQKHIIRYVLPTIGGSHGKRQRTKNKKTNANKNNK